jgi:hypothetical protein
VFEYLYPWDLINASTVSKAFRASALPLSVWKQSIANVPGLPPPPPDMGARDYARVVFFYAMQPMQREAPQSSTVFSDSDEVLRRLQVPSVSGVLIFSEIPTYLPNPIRLLSKSALLNEYGQLRDHPGIFDAIPFVVKRKIKFYWIRDALEAFHLGEKYPGYDEEIQKLISKVLSFSFSNVLCLADFWTDFQKPILLLRSGCSTYRRRSRTL